MNVTVVLDLLVGLAIVIGLVGAVVQLWPGALVVGIAVFVWGAITGGPVGWTVATVAVVLTALGVVLKYLLAGRYLKNRGIPAMSLLVGAVFAVIGFFVIPIVGVFVGFIGGTFIAEYLRLRELGEAWQATVHAMKATGLTIIIELFVALLVTSIWVGGLVLA